MQTEIKTGFGSMSADETAHRKIRVILIAS